MPDLKHFSVSGVLLHNNNVLLVRHTYGIVKGQLLIPGGYLKEGEIPNFAIEREILEETKIMSQANQLVAMRFRSNNWWAIYSMKYLSGTPESDGYENSEAIFLNINEALSREDVTPASKEAIKAVLHGNGLGESRWCPPEFNPNEYKYYGLTE
ncbi:NUDIX domain-containing protein [Paenibacillus mesotrionivorans]|uniref:NUDIX domain-containing protein n=1 Tax=Paenibacillus mesotrionivorans TaxID=3160968 RepID=A0ACC7NY68_9BACL